MPETRTETSAGMETVDETVARIRASLNSPGSPGPSPSSPAASTPNPVLEALTARLTAQGQGIASSSQTNLQQSIADAIRGTERAGDLNRQRIESERGREVDFARDRAGATYTTALEGRSGYATQVAGLRELTETTEKSIRDLDQRYQEALLTNDANTASLIAGLRIKKLEFQAEQEQNFFQNMMSVANLQSQETARLMQSEQFYFAQEQQQKNFMAEMKQSEFQFQKNLALQYDELALKGQELDIARERNQISWAEYSLRKAELNKTKNYTAFQGLINDKLVQQRQGEFAAAMAIQDPTERAAALNNITESATTDSIAYLYEVGFDGSAEEAAQLIQNANANLKNIPLPQSTQGTPSIDKTFLDRILGTISATVKLRNESEDLGLTPYQLMQQRRQE